MAQAQAALDAAGAAPAGLPRRAALTEALWRVGELAQAVADVDFRAAGEVDDGSPAQDAAAALLLAVAHALASPESACPPFDLAPLAALIAGYPPLTLKTAEGPAFYALYPEAVLAAARALPKGLAVIGLRSVGAPLAALAAVAVEAPFLCTVRPAGPPFDRRPRIGPGLAAALLAHAGRGVVVVDEGPGLSGSSFGGVADWLEAQGVPRARIAFLPSHGGDLGPEAKPAHRERWRTATRPTAALEPALAAAGPPLERWFEDLVGPPTAPLEDLSGGLWRALRPDTADAPAWPMQERRKWRLTTAAGRFLLKAAGYAPGVAAKLERVRALHAAGVGVEPLALRHGMLLERWVEDALTPAAPPLAALRRRLKVSRRFPAPPGADLQTLAEMIRVNLTEAAGAAAAAQALAPWPSERLADLQARVRPVFVDGRMHRWEWLQTPDGRVLKADALDHAEAHDLLGAQDIAFDVAGAELEWALDLEVVAELSAAVAADPELLAFHRLAYPAFQLGLWTFAGHSARATAYLAAAHKAAPGAP